MIHSFKDSDTEAVFNLTFVKRFSKELAKLARRKLQLLDAAGNVNDLRVPPGNRLEQLKGDRGQYSIRINDQWRICFVWDDGPRDVEIADYH